MAANGRPKYNPAGLLVAIMMLLLIVVALFIILRSCAAGEPETTPTPPAATLEPSPAGTDTPESAAPSAAPEPSPTPTEAPTPEPTPQPAITGSGSFRSDTGTGLNLVADWAAASSGNGKVTVTVALSVESYSLQCGPVYNGATVTVNGESRSFSTPTIDYDGADSLASSSLGSAVFTVGPNSDGSLSAPVTASWAFGGSYSGTELKVITAEGVISVS